MKILTNEGSHFEAISVAIAHLELAMLRQINLKLSRLLCLPSACILRGITTTWSLFLWLWSWIFYPLNRQYLAPTITWFPFKHHIWVPQSMPILRSWGRGLETQQLVIHGGPSQIVSWSQDNLGRFQWSLEGQVRLTSRFILWLTFTSHLVSCSSMPHLPLLCRRTRGCFPSTLTKLICLNISRELTIRFHSRT